MKKITQKVTYNLYMRPDCWNPLLVPWNIHSTTEVVHTALNASWKEVTEFDPRTMTMVDWYFPVVIPWWLFGKGWSSKWWNKLSDIFWWSEPWLDDAVDGLPTDNWPVI